MTDVTLLPDIGEGLPLKLGKIEILDTGSNHFLTATDTALKIQIHYATNSHNITNINFKYRINDGTWQIYGYSGYTSSHTWTGITLSEGDVIEGRVEVKYTGKGEWYKFPRVPILTHVISRESISIIKRMRRDYNIIETQHGFYVHRIPLIRETMDCECVDENFGRPRAYCNRCDGLGIVGGYDNAEKIKIMLQGKIPPALRGDARIFTRIGEFDRGDANIFTAYDTNLDEGDKIFYDGYRWKVLNDVTIPIAQAKIYCWHAISKEFGLRDEST